MEERIVMTKSAAKAAEKTMSGGCFMAMSAATRKVLSPISENIIMVNAKKKECRGCMRVVGSDFDVPVVNDGNLTSSGSSFNKFVGIGCGISCGFSGRSSGFCYALDHPS